MPLAKRAEYNWPSINLPVSYKALAQDRMADALNVVSNQGLLETRPGSSRYNATSLSGTSSKEINSISYFKNNAGTIHVLAKVQEDIFLVALTGSHTLLSGGFILDEDYLDEDALTASGNMVAANRHRSVTVRGRHLLAIGSNGLYSYDGTTFTQLGQAVPAAPTASATVGGTLVASNAYDVAFTLYDNDNGFETNIGTALRVTTTGANRTITFSVAAPSSADNANMDRVRVYLRDATAAGEYLFIETIALGATPTAISTIPTSTVTPPTRNATPIAGGGQYIVVFGDSIVYAGNATYQSDVIFGTPGIPDAFDDTSTGIRLYAPGNGPITGLGVGFYGGADQEKYPFLCIFKRNSVEVYDSTNGQSTISDQIGCVAHDTIKTINGAVFFMSTVGWHVIINGKIKKDDNNDAYHLGEGDLQSIFTINGYTYAINKGNLTNAFSVYYPTLNQYMTFITESGSTETRKAYNYELNIAGFRPYSFPLLTYAACSAENASGEDIVLMAVDGGFILKHSISEARSDVLANGTTQAINAFFQMFWMGGQDMDSSYNFGSVIMRALESSSAITARYWLDYKYQTPQLETFDFNSDETGFILDVSRLDEGVMGDGRTVITYGGDVFKTGLALLVGFYQNIINANMNILGLQIDVSKNGSRNN